MFRVAYQADVTGDSYGAAWDSRRDEEKLNEDQTELVRDLAGTLDRRLHEIDERLRAAAQNWPLERMSHTDRSVLRCGVAEMMARPGTPVRVVLDESVEIARRFGSEESGRFVNGVLDKVARTLRAAEFA